MKIRTGFVSNSSSSSFIVTDTSKLNDAIKIIEDNKPRIDYYIFKNKLYTNYIYDGCDTYNEIYNNDLFTEYDVGNSTPYNEEEFVEVDGELGLDSVFINREDLTDEDLIELGQAPYQVSSKLYFRVKKFLEDKNNTEKFITDLEKIMNYEDE